MAEVMAGATVGWRQRQQEVRRKSRVGKGDIHENGKNRTKMGIGCMGSKIKRTAGESI